MIIPADTSFICPHLNIINEVNPDICTKRNLRRLFLEILTD